MLPERRRTKSAATVAHDPDHDDDAPAGRSGGQGQRRPPSAAEGRTSGGAAASLERLASVAAFFAARITSPRSSSVAWRPGCRDGCAEARIKSSSRVVIAESALADHRDGAWRIENLGVSGESASRSSMPDAENLQSNQPHAPGRKRPFILPSMVAPPHGLIQSPNERQSLPEYDGMRFCSLGTIPAGEMHEKTLRLRRERREIDDATDVGNDPAALWRQAIRFSAGSPGAGRTASREPTQSNRKRRRFGRRTVGRRSLARASRYRPASPAERPAGRQMLVVAGRACIVSGEEPWRAVAIKHLAKIGAPARMLSRGL